MTLTPSPSPIGRGSSAAERVDGDVAVGLVSLIGALCAWPGAEGGGVKVKIAFAVNVSDFAEG